MSLSKRKKIRRLVILFAVAVAAAAIAPVAGATKLTPTSEQYFVQNRAAMLAYAQRWLPATSTLSEWQGLSPRAAQYLIGSRAVQAAYATPGSSVSIITDNSPSQNRISQAQQSQPYGAPDPWAYRFVHPGGPVTTQFSTGPFISDNSPSQNLITRRNAAQGLLPSPGSSVFDWGDAGVGAGSAVGVMLLLAAAAAVVVRRNHARRLAL